MFVELFSPMFWLAVLAMTAAVIAVYFVLRQSILDALEEHDRRKKEREDAERLRGRR